MKKVIVYLEVDTDDKDELIADDIEREINCCYHSWDNVDIHVIDENKPLNQ